MVTAIVLDVVVLGAFLFVKAGADPFILVVSAAGLAAVVGGERFLMRSHTDTAGLMEM